MFSQPRIVISIASGLTPKVSAKALLASGIVRREGARFRWGWLSLSPARGLRPAGLKTNPVEADAEVVPIASRSWVSSGRTLLVASQAALEKGRRIEQLLAELKGRREHNLHLIA